MTWGLTASTSTSASATAWASPLAAVKPTSTASLARCSERTSQASSSEAEKPAAASPRSMAAPMLPVPMNAMRGFTVDMRGLKKGSGEQGAADAHQIRAFLDRGFKVAAHPHAQEQGAEIRREAVPESAQTAE